MLVVRCDVCNRYIGNAEDKGKLFIRHEETALVSQDRHNMDGEGHQFDICFDCAKALQAVLDERHLFKKEGK